MEEMERAQANMIEAIKKIQESPAAAAVDPEDTYQKGKKEYTAGQLQPAIESLTLYLDRQPNGRHAEEATFKRAEAHYLLKEYKKAIVDYSKFPEKYNKSKHLPTALYKIGQSFEAMGMKDDAKGFYQELVEKFPKSSEARKIPRKTLR
jgi:TolA-binding protein